jgi:hypothetical protein
MKAVRFAVPVAIFGLAMVFSGGCAAFRQSTEDVNVDKSKAYNAKYDYSDMRNMSTEVSDQLLASELIQKQSAAPILAVFEIENRTTIHIDTQAMTDTMRQKLMASQKIKFVNTARRDALLKEQEYQGKNASEATRVAVSKQLGAKYMLTGSIIEMKKQTGRQVRVSAKEEIYYQLTVEITDLETGIVEFASQVERARKESKPLIGW